METSKADNHRIMYLILLVTIAVSLQEGASETTTAPNENYGILVDAGSSSSKIKIYKWSQPKTPTSLPRLDLIDSYKIKVPISSLSENVEDVMAYFRPPLTWMKSKIPKSKRRSTHVLVFATAGLRFLDGDRTKHLLAGVRAVLGNTTRNPFASIGYQDVDVLSGEEEGVYAWIAANYLRGFFDEKKPNSESVGVMEMGGGSTQIAFIPEVPIYAGEFHVTLAGRRYSVYVHSYLNLGSSAVNREILNSLVGGRFSAEDIVEDPCMLKGDNKTVSLGHSKDVEVYGKGSSVECRAMFRRILEPLEGMGCQPKPCTIRWVYQPSIGNTTFYATQAFNYAPRDIGGLRPDGTLDIRALKAAADSYCSMTLEEAQANYTKIKDHFSANCLQSNYFVRLFERYGFSMDTDKIIVTSRIRSQKIDWALGAMLVKLSEKNLQSKGSFAVTCPSRAGNDASNINVHNAPYKAFLVLLSYICIRMSLT